MQFEIDMQSEALVDSQYLAITNTGTGPLYVDLDTDFQDRGARVKSLRPIDKLATTVSNAPGDMKSTLAVEDEPEGTAKGQKMVDINIPWSHVDDNFYYAQGVAYALYESFISIRIDFIDVLKDKNSLIYQKFFPRSLKIPRHFIEHPSKFI